MAARDVGRRWLEVGLVVATSPAWMPLTAALLVLVRITSPGPALVWIDRVGLNGSPLHLPKIRTMSDRVAGPPAGGSSVALAFDRRITPLGTVIRPTHLDELPQLALVLSGKMAIFGPRPESPEFVDRSDPRWEEILAVKPGLVGVNQALLSPWESRHLVRVEDYRDVVLPIKIEIDLAYLASDSLLLDFLAMASVLGSKRTQLKLREWAVGACEDLARLTEASFE
jgi:lipopolysaccharide/colanic/teichoic acid biosynthesis glycosyltransferase